MSLEIIDRRLLPLAGDLATGRYDVLSLDVFDTLLWRRVPEPIDIFVQVGAELIDQGCLASGVSALQFAELRAAAEKQSRATMEAQTGSREIVLDHIYELMSGHIFRTLNDQESAVDLEVACECKSMVLDQDIVTLMEIACANSIRVVLTSDTYFTRDQLLQFLTEAGLEDAQIPETIYISNEYGRPKWRDLFDGILADLAVPADRMVHVGDNVAADVTPCAMRGIAHVFYDKWSEVPRAQGREVVRSASDQPVWLGAGGDYGLTGLRSRLAHRIPQNVSGELGSCWVYGATVLAPLFAAYAKWVADVSSAEGANVLGLMREGRFLSQLVSSVAQSQAVDLTFGELWVSRRAVVRAALWPDDLSLLPQAISYCPGPSTDEVLEQMGLCRADLAGVFQDPAAVDLHAMGGVQALLTGISQSQDLQTKVAAHSARQRKNLMTHLDQHAVFQDEAPIHLLDLGYAGTIQTVLQKILDYEGRPVRLSGLYIAVNAKGKERVLAGGDLRALISEGGYKSNLVKLLERTPDILEHACMCPEGSLDSFDDAGQPVLLPSQRPASQITQMEAMQAGILAGVSEILNSLGAEAVAQQGFHQQAATIVEQAMLHPTPGEVRTIGAWLHEANFDLSDQRALADLRADPARLEFGGAMSWSSFERHEAYWPQAALARVEPVLSGAATLVGEGQAPDVFTSGTMLGTISIIPDLGVGPDERKVSVVPLSLSALGRGEVQIQIKKMGPDAYQSVTMQWPKARAVLMIDQCAVLFRGDTEQRIEDVTGTLKADGEGPVMDGAIMAGDAGATVTVDLSDLLPAWPHSLDLLLRFKYLSLNRIF